MKLMLVPALVVVGLAASAAAANAQDTTAPTIAITTPSEGSVYGQFQDVASSFTCADEAGGSGVAPNEGSLADWGCWAIPGILPVFSVLPGNPFNTTTPGEFTFTVFARDNAGNEATLSHHYTVTADTTPPVVTVTTPPDGAVYTQFQQVQYDFTCTDSGSGVAPPDPFNPFMPLPGCHVQTGFFGDNPGPGAFVNTFNLGPSTVEFRSADRAGNVTEVTRTYTVVEAAPPQSDYAGLVASADPAGHWRLGELTGTTAQDASGNGNHGVYAGGPALGQPGAIAGDADTAAVIDGVNDTVRVEDAPTLDVGASFTAEAWIKRSTATKTHQLMLKGSRGLQLTVMPSTSGNEVWLRKAGVTTIARSSVGVPADGAYHHVVATMDGAGTAKLYVDGADVTVPVPGQHVQVIENTAFPLFFGATGSSASTLDELALYDRALTPSEVATHHAAGGGGGPA